MQDLFINGKLTELQRLAELGRMSAILLHQISNPLTAAMLNLESSDQKSPAVRRARQDIKLVKRYIEAGRQQLRQPSKATSFSVRPQLSELKRVTRPLAHKAGVRLEIGPAPNCQLRGDPVKFQHVLTNLVVNAIDAYTDIGNGPKAVVQISLNHNCGWLIIEVTDWGEGIAAGLLPKIFDAFYTTKNRPGSHGLGIGLAIVKQYVTADFQGSIKASSSSQLGTRFTVKLPVRQR